MVSRYALTYLLLFASPLFASDPPRLQWWDGTQWVELLVPVLTTTSSSSTTTSTSTSTTSSSVPSTTTSTGWIAPTTTTTLVVGTVYSVGPGESVTTALGKLRAGDTLRFRDGTYPMTLVQCGSVNPKLNGGVCNGGGANAKCGTKAAPITLEALNEGRAHFAADGTKPGLKVYGCKGWRIRGLYASSRDNAGETGGSAHTFAIEHSTEMEITRNTVFRTNRCCNCSGYSFTGLTDSLVAENAAWEVTRHGFSYHGPGTANVHQRNYVNTNGRGPSSSCPWKGSKDSNCVTAYPLSFSFFDNNVCEGGAGSSNLGITNQAGGSAFPGEQPSSWNTWSGNITADTFMCTKVLSRPTGGDKGVEGNLFQDHLCIRPKGFAFRNSVSIDTTVRRLTSIGAGGEAPAFQTDDPAFDSNDQHKCDRITGGDCKVTLEDALLIEGDGRLMVEAADNAPQYCTLRNVVAKSFLGLAENCAGSGGNQCACTGKSTVLPMNVGVTGTKCVFCRPGDVACDGKGNGGGNIGADPRCRYEKGVKTAASVFGPDGQLTFCPAQIPGVTDGSISGGRTCDNYAERVLNHRRDGTGCPLTTVACPS